MTQTDLRINKQRKTNRNKNILSIFHKEYSAQQPTTMEKNTSKNLAYNVRNNQYALV